MDKNKFLVSSKLIEIIINSNSNFFNHHNENMLKYILYINTTLLNIIIWDLTNY
jgi:hypothetical protein